MDSSMIQLTEVTTGNPVWVSTAHIVAFYERETRGDSGWCRYSDGLPESEGDAGTGVESDERWPT